MWVEGHWVEREDYLGLGWIKAGDYDPTQLIPDGAYEPTLDRHQVTSLIEYALSHGLVPLQITPESRTEDLKIIHRLLDMSMFISGRQA